MKTLTSTKYFVIPVLQYGTLLYNSLQVHALKAIHQESNQEYILKGSVGRLFASCRGGLASGPVVTVLNRKASTCSDSNILLYTRV